MTELIEITCMPADMNNIIKNEAVVEVQSGNGSSRFTTVYDQTLDCWSRDDSGGNKFDSPTSNGIESSKDIRMKQKSRADIVSQELGQYLLKGYKMLAETCDICGCVLMQDNTRQNHCIGCNLDKSNAESKASKSPQQVEVQPSIEAIPLRRDDGPVKLTEINSTSSDDLPSRCLVQGVDVSPELQRAVRSLKEKLVRLSAQLETITDHQELADCLTSMTTTVSVLEKIKKI